MNSTVRMVLFIIAILSGLNVREGVPRERAEVAPAVTLRKQALYDFTVDDRGTLRAVVVCKVTFK
jgi:hypothetical protein